jgi:hypothetical protein
MIATPTCPACDARLDAVQREQERPVYRCPRHGALVFVSRSDLDERERAPGDLMH